MKKIETDADWLGGTDPQKMWEFLRGKASERKLRLFAFACEQRVWRHGMICKPQDEGILDQFIEGKGCNGDVRKYLVAQRRVEGRYHSHQMAKYALSAVLKDDAAQAASETASFASGYVYFLAIERNQKHTEHPADADEQLVFAARAARDAETKDQSILLRDIFGNPIRPVALGASWLTPQVVALAQGIYKDRAYGRLPILADALKEAGCTNPEVLNHCLSEGPHVRGCWVVDLLLRKE
jgi:hypothetical protein